MLAIIGFSEQRQDMIIICLAVYYSMIAPWGEFYTLRGGGGKYAAYQLENFSPRGAKYSTVNQRFIFLSVLAITYVDIKICFSFQEIEENSTNTTCNFWDQIADGE